MEEQKVYFAFISYQRKDEEWADRLRNKLEHYQLPSSVRKQDASLPKEIRPIFRDALELAGGVLAKEIETALQNSKYLIVICSPNSAKSPWVNKEIQTFIYLGREDHIIPFIIDGTPFSDNEDTECFPPALRSLKGEKELLGININELSRDAAAIKVVARMFGLKFDTLWQRYEREKKRKRWMIIGGALLFAFVSLGIGGHIAKQNRELDSKNKEIRKERDRANTEKKRAEKTSDSLRVAFDSITQQNILIQQQRNDLDKSNNELQLSLIHLAEEKLETQKQYAKFIAQKANELMDDNDYLTARRIIPDVLPNKSPRKLFPYVPEIEQALRRSFDSNSGIIYEPLGNFHTILLSPDGKTIVSCVKRENIKLWDAQTGLLVYSIPNTSSSPSIRFSPQGKLFISANGNLTIWDVNNKEKLQSINWGKSINDIDYRNRLLSLFCKNGGNYTLEIIDGYTGKLLSAIPTNGSKLITSAMFLSDDKIITASLDDSIKIWSIKSKTMIRGWKAHEFGVDFLCLNKDKSILASGEYGKISVEKGVTTTDSLRLWDVKTGKQIRAIPISVRNASFSSDGNCIIASKGNDIVIINAYTGDIIKTLSGHKRSVSKIVTNQQNRLFISSSSDGSIRIWDDYLYEPYKEGKKSGSIYTAPVAFYPDGSKYLITAVDTIMVFTTKLSKLVKKFGEENTPMFSSIKFNKDGSKFITTGSIATIWDSSNFIIKKDILIFKPNYAEISPNGKEALTITGGNEMCIWDVSKEGSSIDLPEKTFNAGEKSNIKFASFSPTGKSIVSAHDDGLIKLWNMKDNVMTDCIKGHEKSVNSVCYSSDGKFIVSASADNTIKIWNVKNKKCIRTLIGHTNEVCYAEFDSESKYVISTSFDNTVRIWDVSSGTILKTFFNQGKTAAISPDGQRIIIVDGPGSFRIIPYPSLQELIDKVRLQ